MAKVDSDVVAELKKLVSSEKVVFGTEETLKFLRQGKLKKVILASNCDPSVRADVERYCRLGSIEFVVITQTNEEIGVVCRKPFAISVVGITA